MKIDIYGFVSCMNPSKISMDRGLLDPVDLWPVVELCGPRLGELSDTVLDSKS